MATERLDIVVSERGSRRTSRNIAKIGTAARTAQSGVSLLRSALGALGGALILRSTIRTLADFSQSMSTIQAITGETGRAFDTLRERAKSLGIQTRFSATQAAEGMVFLARTGFDANEVLQTIQGTLNLAQVGLIDVARAADIASNVLKGFRLEANQMSRVIDVLAKTSSRSNTNVEQLGDAMSFAAPAAAALGISVETTAAAIGVLSDAGIQATRAGSGLRTSFIKLLAGVGAAKKSLKAVGLTLNDVDIESRGLVPVLQTLSDANIGLAQATELVGIRQANNLLIMIDSLPRLKELQAENIAATNTAEKMAEVMDDNLNGALFRVKSAFEGVIIALGDAGGESGLRSLLEKTAQFLRIVASNADALAKALTILGTVILGRLVVGAIAILISQLKKLSVAIVLLSARLIPALAAAAITSFAILGAIAAAEGENIEDTFERLKDTVIGFFRDIVIPTDAIQGFSEEIEQIAGALEEATAGGLMVKSSIVAFIDTIEELKTRISDQLLITEFLAPGSEAVETLTAQVETLDAALKRLRDIQTGKGLVVDLKVGDPKAMKPKLHSFVLDLEQEKKLLKLTNREREIRQVILDAEAANGGELRAEHELLIETLARENRSLREQREVIEDILAPAEDYRRIIDALNGSLAKLALSEKERSDAMRNARIEFLNQQTDLASGVERTFLKMGRDSEDLATGIEDALTNAFRNAGDALAEFVETGKLDFASLIRSIQRDLIQLSIKGAITGPLGKLLSGESLDQPGGGTFGGFGGLIGDFFGSQGGETAAGAVTGAAGAATEAAGAAALTAAGASLTAAGATLTASAATLTASGASLTAAAASHTAASATVTAASATLTAAGAALTAAAGALAASGASGGLEGIIGAVGASGGGGTGFARGGSFVVGGSGGVDQTNVGFKASRGEEVTIRTKEQQREGKGGNITQIWNIKTQDDIGFRRNAHQIMGQASSGIQRARLKG